MDASSFNAALYVLKGGKAIGGSKLIVKSCDRLLALFCLASCESSHRAQRSQVCLQFKISTMQNDLEESSLSAIQNICVVVSVRDPAPSCDSICLQIVPSCDIRRTQCLWALRYITLPETSSKKESKGRKRFEAKFRSLVTRSKSNETISFLTCPSRLIFSPHTP